MKVDQKTWTPEEGWRDTVRAGASSGARLVLLFGARARLQDVSLFQQVRDWYPEAMLVGCSTAGEICGTEVRDDSLVATAVAFEHTRIQLARARVDAPEQSHAAGETLARALHARGTEPRADSVRRAEGQRHGVGAGRARRTACLRGGDRRARRGRGGLPADAGVRQ